MHIEDAICNTDFVFLCVTVYPKIPKDLNFAIRASQWFYEDTSKRYVYIGAKSILNCVTISILQMMKLRHCVDIQPPLGHMGGKWKTGTGIRTLWPMFTTTTANYHSSLLFHNPSWNTHQPHIVIIQFVPIYFVPWCCSSVTIVLVLSHKATILGRLLGSRCSDICISLSILPPKIPSLCYYHQYPEKQEDKSKLSDLQKIKPPGSRKGTIQRQAMA